MHSSAEPISSVTRRTVTEGNALSEGHLAGVVEALCTANERLLGNRLAAGRRAMPSRDAIDGIIDEMRAVLFPFYFGSSEVAAASLRYHVGARLDKLRYALVEQVRCGLFFACQHEVAPSTCATCTRRAGQVVDEVILSLPRLRALLETDIQAAYDADPAAQFPEETLYCYPGFTAILEHRFAHELYRRGVPLIPRIMAELAHARTGVDIHPGATIGASFFIDHGTGVVIGETCHIGDRVRIFQGVTLGARGAAGSSPGSSEKGVPRHPLVEDDVVIYAGATVLGRITIGRGATIGGNVWLTRNVAAGTVVSQAQTRHDRFQGGAGI